MKISEISKLTQVPASTIRAYERLHFIEPAERLNNGYRIFNKRHILQIKLCRLIFRGFIYKNTRKFSFQIIEAAVKWDIPHCKHNVEESISRRAYYIKQNAPTC
jgi:DNA-binding transcriptional MerR regulator